MVIDVEVGMIACSMNDFNLQRKIMSRSDHPFFSVFMSASHRLFWTMLCLQITGSGRHGENVVFPADSVSRLENHSA